MKMSSTTDVQMLYSIKYCVQAGIGWYRLDLPSVGPRGLYCSLERENTHTHAPTATAESTKALTGLVTVNNANKIATRLVYDTLRVELVWANRIEGAPMPRHQITPALR